MRTIKKKVNIRFNLQDYGIFSTLSFVTKNVRYIILIPHRIFLRQFNIDKLLYYSVSCRKVGGHR